MFRLYMLSIIRLRFNLQGVAIQAVWGVFESIGVWGEGRLLGTRSRCFNSGYHDLGLLLV